MITGFEEQTEALSDEEMRQAADIADMLYRNPIWHTSDEIARYLGLPAGNRKAGPRIRKIVNHIRRSGMVPCLIATSQGYKVATSRSEVLEYLHSLEGRLSAIAAVKRALASQMEDVFPAGEQLDLIGEE
jgi:hypothetical protein